MHPEAREFVARFASPAFRSVLEIGSRDINGSVRPLFQFAHRYVGLDLQPGPGVDVVADAVGWEPDGVFDLVLCCEVLEHAPDIVGIIDTAARALCVGGMFVVTCATNPREPHSAGDGGKLPEGEHYRNIAPVTLCDEMLRAGFQPCAAEISETRGDLYVQAVREE